MDASGVDSATPDDSGTNDAGTPECTNNAKECVGNKTRVCVDGHWAAPAGCTDDKPICVGGECSTPASCGTLLGTCGTTNPQNCCNAPVAEGATFNRYNKPAFPATISNVRLGRYEVTVARFRSFVAAGRGTATSAPAPGEGAHPKVASSGWQASYNAQLLANSTDLANALTNCAGFPNATYQPAGVIASNNKPINCVTWFEALAFCIWDGGRLPTVGELELATRGGAQQRAYPWGATAMDATLAFYCSSKDGATLMSCPAPDAPGMLDVGSKPNGAGRWGHLDLFGSMRDYGLDIWTPMPAMCNDCVQTDTASSTTHAALGGSWSENNQNFIQIYNQAPTTSTNPRTSANGFRCAYDL